MRIVVGSFQQESNTLVTRKSTIEDFNIFYGEEMLSHIAASNYFSSLGFEMIPTLYAHALPGGCLCEKDFWSIAEDLVSRMPSQGIDGIWLYLHGALEVENVGSGELALMRMVRQKVGYQLPIALALDFHANNTFELMKLVNVIVGYRTAPHRDMLETEIRAANLLVQCCMSHIFPEPQMTRVNVVVPGDCVLTDESPLREIMAEASALEKTPGMLICNVFNGQPWVDSPNMGPSMVCIHERDIALAKAASQRLAQMFFEARHAFKFSVDAYEPDEAVERAWAENRRPVFVTDSGDNTTAGSSGDNAFLLKLVQEKHMRDVLIGGITDASAVENCLNSSIRQPVEFDVGGSIEPSSVKTHICGELLYKGDVEGWYGENAGLCIVVRSEDIDVIITARRCAFTRPRIFEKLGLDIASYRFVVVKLGYLYPDLEKIAARTILAFTCGSSTERLQDMHMKRIRRPIFPLDDNFSPAFE